MDLIQRIRCSNCGSYGQRRYLQNKKTIQTSCSNCDYYLEIGSETGKVIEAYAPGIYCGVDKLKTAVSSIAV